MDKNIIQEYIKELEFFFNTEDPKKIFSIIKQYKKSKYNENKPIFSQK